MASSRSSGLKTSSGVISSTRNRINAITVNGDGTNAVTVILYDNASTNSGLVLAKITPTATQKTTHIIFENPVMAEDGIYLTISGTGAEAIVYFGG